MSAQQKERDRRAELTVQRLISEQARPERVLAFLREIARDPKNIDYTPHLVTAIRAAGYWPLLQAIDLTQ